MVWVRLLLSSSRRQAKAHVQGTQCGAVCWSRGNLASIGRFTGVAFNGRIRSADSMDEDRSEHQDGLLAATASIRSNATVTGSGMCAGGVTATVQDGAA